jgi:3'(2'), 5'-bisphosphate nucleotidase
MPMDGSTMPEELEQLVAPLIDLCREAGEVIRGRYHAPGADRFESKPDHSPLTRADLDSHQLLSAGLAALRPRLPVLSEESAPALVAPRRQWPRYWLVDPLDGTREFLQRTGDFSINIALVEEHRARLGLLYLPLTETTYVGIPGRGARCFEGPAAGSGRPLRTRALQPGRPLQVLTSRRYGGSQLTDWLQRLRQQWGPVEQVPCGGALKFCYLVEGKGDIYPRFSPCSEWDTAAGQAVLEAAGGSLVDLQGAPLRYNRGTDLSSPHFYALADPGHELWRSLAGNS